MERSFAENEFSVRNKNKSNFETRENVEYRIWRGIKFEVFLSEKKD